MTQSYVGEQITLEAKFTDSAGDPADPTTVTFKYRVGRYGLEQAAPVTNPEVGTYQAIVTPIEDGNLYGFFQGTGTIDRIIPVRRAIFRAEGIRNIV